MDRRRFLTNLLLAAPGALLLPSRTIFLPPAGGWPVDDYFTLQWPFIVRNYRLPEELTPVITPLRNGVIRHLAAVDDIMYITWETYGESP